MRFGSKHLASAAILLLAASTVSAQDSLILAVGQRGAWETSIPELGRQAGFFKQRGLELDIVYTQGGGETQQVVISGSADIGVGLGMVGVMGAFAKGAPVRVIGAQATGPADFWYVESHSPIIQLKDYKQPATIAYSTTGGSTHTGILRFIKTYGLSLRPVATGGPQATLTQLLSRQIDVGWTTPPLGVDRIDRGELRIVGKMRDIPVVQNQTVRVNVVNARTLASKPEAIARFMQAYRETLAWLYEDPKAMDAYAAYGNYPVALATRVRDEFFPRAMLDPDRIFGIEDSMEDAVDFKALPKPLTGEQIKQLIQVPKSIP